MYYVYGMSGPSPLIESTDSMISLKTQFSGHSETYSTAGQKTNSTAGQKTSSTCTLTMIKLNS